jgi:hypothetical protein
MSRYLNNYTFVGETEPERSFSWAFSLIFIGSLLFILSLYGCATTPAHVTGKIYPRTLPMTVNGKAAVGIHVVDRASTYKIKVPVPKNADVVRLYTCHRESILYERERRGGIFGTGVEIKLPGRREPEATEHEFSISPPLEMENEGYCPMNVEILNVDGMNYYGLIDVRNEELPAFVACNGELYSTTGVSLCQARVGLVQRIQFKEPVDAKAITEGCDEPAPAGDGFFDVSVKPETCVYLFSAQDKYHRMTVFGYTDLRLKSIAPENQ